MTTNNKRRALSAAAVLLLPSAVILTAIWLPFGFSMIGLIEEWDLLGLFTIHGTFLAAHLDGPLPAHNLRPLMPLSFGLAYLADRDSFVGWHLLTLAALLVKGGAMTYLVGRATGSRAWGVVAAVLVLLYPADTMQLSFRSIHINVALALSLVGCALLVRAFEARSTVHAVAIATVASLLYLIGIGIYEVALTLIALPMAIWLVRHGWVREARPRARQLGLLAFWFASACLYLGYAAWLAPKIASYQGKVTGDKQALIATVSATWPKLFTVGGARALIGGWLDAARMVSTEYASFLYLGCSVCAIAVVALLAVRSDQRSRALPQDDALVSRMMVARLVIAGLVLMLMGYAPFLTSPAHLVSSQRTFLWATPGAVMVWVGVLIVLWRFARAPTVVALLVLLLLGFSAQLFQLHHYVNISERQRSLLRAIVENFDAAATPSETLLVLDGTGQLGDTWFFIGDGLHYALSYLYGRRIGAIEICRIPSMEWQRVDPLVRKGHCVEDDTGWTLNFPHSATGPGMAAATVPEPSRRLAKEHTVVVKIDAHSTSVARPALANYRHRLEMGAEIVDRRYRNILAPRSPGPIGPMFRDEFVGERYRWDFGDWWSLDLPPRGAGWRSVEWLGHGFSQRSGAWKIAPTAELDFELAPATGNYAVGGSFEHFASDAVRSSVGLRMNGQPLTLQWVSQHGFRADVPTGILIRGINRLEFVSDLDDRYYGVSVWLDWVEVTPR